MQLCRHCGTENLEGTIYCQQCGVALLAVPLSTRRLRASEGSLDGLALEGVLVLQVGDAAAPILVQLRNEIVLGRYSQQDDGRTYINLTPYGADQAGVSRRHARLILAHQTVYLMDLNSTNGTMLNGEPLPVAVERRVHDGDEITLGRLRILVYFGS